MKPSPEKTEAKMVCGDVFKLDNERYLIPLERAPMGDWALMQMLGETNG